MRELGRGFDGEVGIAVREVDSDWSTSWNGRRFFPQQSVSKFWVALTAFNAVDAGVLDLDQPVTIRREDLTLFHQPIAAQVGADGYTTTLGNLLFRALTQSDNTCNDAMLRAAGGPDGGARHARPLPDRGHPLRPRRADHAEPDRRHALAAELFGRPRLLRGAQRGAGRPSAAAAFQNYIADPIDGATVDGIVEALARLRRGELLSPRSTERMLSIMSQTRTGPQRLTGGLAPGWRIAHKTGTGQVLGATQAGYNDIGILTSPEGRHYAVAVMIGRTATRAADAGWR